MKNKLFISGIRKIKQTYKRFISLLCMSLLGVGFFAGIQATSPDMLNTLDNYYDDYNVYDIEIASTLGLTNNDIKALEEIDNVSSVTGIYTKDVLITISQEEYNIKLIGLNENINKLYLIEGNTPKEPNEIVVEEEFLTDNNYEIGDTITIKDEDLSSQEYIIIGTVLSPLYISTSRGTSTVGNGQIDYFIYTTNDTFNNDYYSYIYLTVDNTKELVTNSNTYQEHIDEVVNDINNIKDTREEERFQEVYKDYIETANTYNIELDTTSLTPSTWYISDRYDNSGYKDMVDATENIAKIGNVFPIVFYVIAVLISLISMMRMVEEDRLEIGTLKSLGFNNQQIIWKYLSYALLATLIGGLLGMIIGLFMLPTIIWSIYQMIFNVPNFTAEFHIEYGLFGLIISIICICGTTIYTTHKVLKSTPATLMRPKTPLKGKRILLERITIIWNKLKFSNKITIRNLFRYKSRVIATIIGISGCTALILSGFGLKDSIENIVTYQFENVFKYDEVITLKTNNNYDNLLDELNNNSNITNIVETRMETITIYNDDNNVDTTLIIDNGTLDKVINLNNINNDEIISTQDNTIILSEKLAKLLEIEENQEITIKKEGQDYNLKVIAIVENYINNYAYINLKTYNDIFGNYQTNTILLTKNNTPNDFETNILSYNEVSSVTLIEDTVKDVTSMMDSLNSVIIILILSSIILAFVVLYNLSNINISERKREIATLKVLGFYDKEVDSYITKENIILTIVGIILGLVAGLYLCHYIISTCETDNLMFVRDINIKSYIYSSIITTIFTIIVNIITHYNLRKIDMIESLKNVE